MARLEVQVKTIFMFPRCVVDWHSYFKVSCSSVTVNSLCNKTYAICRSSLSLRRFKQHKHVGLGYLCLLRGHCSSKLRSPGYKVNQHYYRQLFLVVWGTVGRKRPEWWRNYDRLVHRNNVPAYSTSSEQHFLAAINMTVALPPSLLAALGHLTIASFRERNRSQQRIVSSMILKFRNCCGPSCRWLLSVLHVLSAVTKKPDSLHKLGRWQQRPATQRGKSTIY